MISDPSSGQAILTASSGDYVYPSDVRFNADTSRLYVKTQGLSGGIWPTTDLFEYDLSKRRLLQRADAHNARLLGECPGIDRLGSRPTFEGKRNAPLPPRAITRSKR